jgi:hypothetical protein
MKGESGVCVACKEWTEVGNSCCGAGVSFEGHIIHDEDVEDEADDAPESIAHARMRKTFANIFPGGLSDLRSPEEKARTALNRVRPVEGE